MMMRTLNTMMKVKMKMKMKIEKEYKNENNPSSLTVEEVMAGPQHEPQPAVQLPMSEKLMQIIEPPVVMENYDPNERMHVLLEECEELINRLVHQMGNVRNFFNPGQDELPGNAYNNPVVVNSVLVGAPTYDCTHIYCFCFYDTSCSL